MRDELVNETLFCNFAHVRERIAAGVTDDNTEMPHATPGSDPRRLRQVPYY